MAKTQILMTASMEQVAEIISQVIDGKFEDFKRVMLSLMKVETQEFLSTKQALELLQVS